MSAFQSGGAWYLFSGEPGNQAMVRYLFSHLVLHCISEVEDINHQGDIPIPQVARVVILHSCIEQFSEVGGSTNGGSCE